MDTHHAYILLLFVCVTIWQIWPNLPNMAIFAIFQHNQIVIQYSHDGYLWIAYDHTSPLEKELGQ